MASTGKSRRVAHRSGNRHKVRRNRRRFNFRRLIAPLLVMMIATALGFGVYSLLSTPKLQIERVIVHGPRLIPVSMVQSDAAVAIGSNILTAPREDVRKRVLKHPEVRDVTVGRRLPRTLVVNVIERSPRVTLSEGKSFWMVDAGGLPFHQIGRPLASIPVVRLPDGSRVLSGKKVENPGLMQAMECLRACPSLARRISKISVDRAGNVCLNIGSDFYVKLGQPVEISRKMAELSKLLSAQPDIGKKVEYINMSCYQAPALKLKPIGAARKPAEST